MSIDSGALIHAVYAGALLVVGLAIGSFLNVVAYRLPLNRSLVRPGSSCPTCGQAINAFDNIPLLSWLLLGGKCRKCQAPISSRYPLVEAITGILWCAVGWRLAGMYHGMALNIFYGLLQLAFLSALVVTFLIDWDYQIIPDEISLGGLVVTLIAAPLLPLMHHADHGDAYAQYYPLLDALIGEQPAWLRSFVASAAGAATGLLFSLAIYYLGTMAFQKQIQRAQEDDPDIDSALGLGDVKFMAFLGAFQGWRAVFLIYLFGSILGAAMGSYIKLRSGDSQGETGLAGLRNRWQTGGSVIPFGPFLVIGSAIVFFFDSGINTIATRLFLPQ